ncbi:hypothetical protein BO225_10950, partial [Dubosiella newyorkensis]
MKTLKKWLMSISVVFIALMLTGCSAFDSITGGKRIIRIAHAQSEEHPEHIGMLEFKKIIEEKLGDKYEVEIFPNELLGSAQ